MGFHMCEYCLSQGKQPETSSGDVRLSFTTHNWVMPDMIIHYIRDHNYLPPQEFINDVLHGTFTNGAHAQAKNWGSYRQVGYLSGDYPQAPVPTSFLDRLQSFMQQASKSGQRIQTRGIQI